LLVAVQEVFDATENAAVPGASVTFWFEGVTDNVGIAPAWVTVTDLLLTPVPETVIVAVLVSVLLFIEYVAVIVPLPLPEGLTVHQD
jgi:energy-converting hydrogenase Eha subunit H